MTQEILNTTYNPETIETKWYEFWETSGYFKPTPNTNSFCIMLPPPNVTGTLHMGHAFEVTIMDTLVRWQRMQGNQTLWQPGTDHAGIATQMLVERDIQKENLSKHQLGRDAFLNKIWDWKKKSGNQITQQLRELGASLDWSREKFTMDPELNDTVKQVFIQLYEEGLIYRGKRLVNWDPKLKTAISDLEVISTEESGSLWHINYQLAHDANQFITVATTRPETLFGDVAIAVNPTDTRYQPLIGKEVIIPLTSRTIPIIADAYVEKEFGTGCLKITPAHDFNDATIAKQHQLTPINILTPEAALTNNDYVPKAYQNLDRFVARKAIIQDLDNEKLLVATKEHTLMIPRGDRSGSIIEPYLTDQWYVKVDELATPAINAVKNGDIKFVPDNWQNTYFAWMNNLEDWCISRQLWWGHRIPAWYDSNGCIFVGKDEKEVRKKYNLSPDKILTQDEDVLDTWFSSALWPFSTLGWPKQTKALNDFYPTNVLVTGFDIIFFWVARMIMMGLKLTQSVPFNTVYIHGLIRDSEGKKMSKSKGNVLDPLDLIHGINLEELVYKRTHHLMQPNMAEKIAKKTNKEFPKGIQGYGTDALRFTFASLASNTRNIQFDFKRLEGYRNFCNKLWNANRYILMHIKNDAEHELWDGAIEHSIIDNWIHHELQEVIQTVNTHLKSYRFDLAASCLYEFVWHEFCDWYLELSKTTLFNTQATPAQIRGTKQTLIDVFETLLRLLHPIIPFITEEIWQHIAPLSNRFNYKSIMLAPYPKFEKKYLDNTAKEEVNWLKSMIISLRTLRSEMNISPAKPIPLLCKHGSEKDKERLQEHKQYLTSLMKIHSIDWLKDNQEEPLCATTLVAQLELKVPLAGLIDINKEIERLEKELTKLKKEFEKINNKLQNQSYVKKAPAQLIEKDTQRINEIKTHTVKLETQKKELLALA